MSKGNRFGRMGKVVSNDPMTVAPGISHNTHKTKKRKA